MNVFQPFLRHLMDTPLVHWVRDLPAIIEAGLDPARYGDLPRWRAALEQLPRLNPDQVWLDRPAVTVSGAITADQREQLETALKGLHPWRKGPFDLFGVAVDTEWRSDWKWDRVAPHIQPLDGKMVLDVGCGSGYHLWRMRGAGAETALGIEPTPLFLMQFEALQRYINDTHVGILPMGIEKMPPKLHAFDTVFSMGILYHRRSPFDHLLQLKELLVEDGELVLETLVVDGPPGHTLVPEGRYARMGNVWFIPSPDTLPLWLTKAGFRDAKVVDVTTTSTEEQRRTDWMQFHSLEQFLDPDNPALTVEGYPAPKRAVVIARR